MEKEKKEKKVLIIVCIVLVIITVILLVLKGKTKQNKVLTNYDYIIENKTDYSDNENKGLLPIINLKGSDIEEINDEIIEKYYGASYADEDIFYYDYNIYKDVLSLYIKITNIDGSEFGKFDYNIYNINVVTGKRLTDEELLDYLKIDSSVVSDVINSRLLDYYNNDDLKEEMSYEEYVSYLEYEPTNNKLFISEDSLNSYIDFKVLTQSLIQYSGNIYELKIQDL